VPRPLVEFHAAGEHHEAEQHRPSLLRRPRRRRHVLGPVTVTGGAAQAAASCTGDVSIYGTLSDGKLTYTQIEPNTGDRIKTLIGPALGFTPKAMATLNFNTVLVTSIAGDLYRVDVQTNNTTLALAGVEKIWDGGWTFDKMVYDGAGTFTARSRANSTSTSCPRTSPRLGAHRPARRHRHRLVSRAEPDLFERLVHQTKSVIGYVGMRSWLTFPRPSAVPS
jgi:hypothetical protein